MVVTSRAALFCALAALAALAAAAPAQTILKVVPKAYAGIEGPWSSRTPFSWETARTQILYRTGAMASGGGVILSLDFRKDGNSTLYTALTRNLTIDAYVTPLTPAAMSTTFAANRGTNPATQVFNAVANLPAQAAVPTPPAAWSINLAFSRPLPFVIAQGNLVLEFVCGGPGSAVYNYYVDGEYMSTQPGGRSTLIGMYCEGANKEVFKCDPVASTWVLGGSGDFQWGPGGSQPTSIVAFLGNRTDRWGPVPLPFDLAPLGGIGYGSDKCRIYTNWLASIAIPNNQVGKFGPIPNDPALEDVTLYTQGLAPVQGANPLGLIMGPAFAVTIGSGKPPTGDLNLIYLENDLNGATGKFGSSGAFTGPITRFNGTFN